MFFFVLGMNPSQLPSVSPSKSPSQSPSISPTNNPTTSPTSNPSIFPTKQPSNLPSIIPTKNPTMTGNPTIIPTTNPTRSCRGYGRFAPDWLRLRIFIFCDFPIKFKTGFGRRRRVILSSQSVGCEIFDDPTKLLLGLSHCILDENDGTVLIELSSTATLGVNQSLVIRSTALGDYQVLIVTILV